MFKDQELHITDTSLFRQENPVFYFISKKKKSDPKSNKGNCLNSIRNLLKIYNPYQQVFAVKFGYTTICSTSAFAYDLAPTYRLTLQTRSTYNGTNIKTSRQICQPKHTSKLETEMLNSYFHQKDIVEITFHTTKFLTDKVIK